MWHTNPISYMMGSALFLDPQESFLKHKLGARAGPSRLYAAPTKDAHTDGSCRFTPQTVSQKAFKEAPSISSRQGQGLHKQYISLLTKFTFPVPSSSLSPVHRIQGTSRSTPSACRQHHFTALEPLQYNNPGGFTFFFFPETFTTLKYFIDI